MISSDKKFFHPIFPYMLPTSASVARGPGRLWGLSIDECPKHSLYTRVLVCLRSGLYLNKWCFYFISNIWFYLWSLRKNGAVRDKLET